MITAIKDTSEFYNKLTNILSKGGIVALPTDTVYGLAVDATAAGAIEKLRTIKGRDKKPFALFMPKGSIREYAVFTKRKIIDYFVPGPITVVMKKKKGINLPGVGETIGIRVPNTGFVIRFLNDFGKPLAVTSANRSGASPCTTAEEIAQAFPEVAMIVDAGTLHSQPSTVVDVTTTPPTILRKGATPILEIEKVYGRRIMLGVGLKFNVLFVCSGNSCRSPMAEGIFKTMVSDTYCRVRSAGTLHMNGMPASEYAQEVVEEYGGSIAQHLSQTVTRDMIAWADLILVMEYQHYTTVLEIESQAAVKTFLLKEYKRKTQYNKVHDPVGKEKVVYEQTARDMLPSLRFVARDVMRRFKV